MKIPAHNFFMASIKTLRDVVKEDTLPFIPICQEVKVLDVYDGDTITVAGQVQGVYYRFIIRIHGIDTPEIRTTNPQEKQAGLQARTCLEDLLADQIIQLSNISPDKYGGRFLAHVMFQDIDVAQYMIKHGHALPYDGGKKVDYNPNNYTVNI